MVKGILVDVLHGTCQQTTLDGTLDGYYKALNCDIITMVERSICGTNYTVILDDEGLLNDNPIVSAFDSKGNWMFVGNYFICRDDGFGDVESLDKTDVEHIMDCVRELFVVTDEGAFVKYKGIIFD